ncbi:MAG: CPBP family intramembrane metalloprotease [Planctomycetota bacterium]|nr:MAG: CPBP family intramembrane metalloprotease [Planctomycetota bacterium]
MIFWAFLLLPPVALVACVVLASAPRAVRASPGRPRTQLGPLVGAAVLLWGLPMAVQGLWPDRFTDLPMRQSLVAGAALLAWGFLRLSAGPLPPWSSSLRLSWAVRAYLAFLPAFLLFWWLYSRVGLWIGGEAPVQEVVSGMSELSSAELIWMALLAVGVQPLVEEVLFRGYLQGALSRRADFGARRALLFSTAAFTLGHDPAVWPPVFGLGLLFGWLYWQGGGLWATVAVHALHNGLALLFVLLTS